MPPITTATLPSIALVDPSVSRERVSTAAWDQARITFQGQTTVVPRLRAEALAALLRSQEPSLADWANAPVSIDTRPMPGPPVISIELLQNGQTLGRLEANSNWTRWTRQDANQTRRITQPTREEAFVVLADEVRRLRP